MKKTSDSMVSWTEEGRVVVGLDLGDKESRWKAVVVGTGEVRSGTVPMSPESVTAWMKGAPHSCVVMEAGTHAAWVAQLLRELDHEVAVVPSDALVRGRRRNKNDERDCDGLVDLGLDMNHKRVHTIWVRPEEYQRDLALMGARDNLVRARTAVANGIRGLVKPLGERVKKHSVESLPNFARKELSAKTLVLVAPMLEALEGLNTQIAACDELVEAYLARRPESVRLRGPKGVGPVIAGTYLAVIGDPKRFKSSRNVPAYLGLAPWQHQSGERDPQMGISKAGSELLRRQLVQGAQYMLGPFGEDSDLRRWGLKLAGDGTNKARKKRAVVAVARKLAILLHHLWVSRQEYKRFNRGA
jgi:transposase